FAVAFWMGTAVQAFVALGQGMSLLLADEHDAKVAETGEPRADGAVVAEGPIAVQLQELLEDQLDVVQRLRPFVMARHLDRLPGRQAAVALPLEVHQFAANPSNLFAIVL